jgi:hypothetical protein
MLSSHTPCIARISSSACSSGTQRPLTSRLWQVESRLACSSCHSTSAESIFIPFLCSLRAGPRVLSSCRIRLLPISSGFSAGTSRSTSDGVINWCPRTLSAGNAAAQILKSGGSCQLCGCSYLGLKISSREMFCSGCTNASDVSACPYSCSSASSKALPTHTVIFCSKPWKKSSSLTCDASEVDEQSCLTTVEFARVNDAPASSASWRSSHGSCRSPTSSSKSSARQRTPSPPPPPP